MYCQHCGTRVPNHGKFCPSCGHQIQNDANPVGSHIKTNSTERNVSDGTQALLEIESKKKSGIIAALLNLILPGVGYAYCGNWILGIFAFFFVLILFIASFGLLSIFLALMLFVDGFLAADRYNKRLTKRVLAEMNS